MAHEVISDGRPDICEIDPAMLQAAADEISSAERARSRREQLAKKSFVEAVLLPVFRRARTEFSNGLDIG